MTTMPPDSNVTITPEACETLARGIVMEAKSIREWLDQPETQARYQKWLAERNARKAKSSDIPEGGSHA